MLQLIASTVFSSVLLLLLCDLKIEYISIVCIKLICAEFVLYFLLVKLWICEFYIRVIYFIIMRLARSPNKGKYNTDIIDDIIDAADIPP